MSIVTSLPSVPVLADYVSREELAKELKVTTRTLDKWAWLRNGPVKIKIGSRCYYHRADVNAWIEAQRHRAQEAA
ncbi:helix-turn-helix domain-containing protein [Dyella sp. EPa41]|uniref:helix-turn-helix transcriptional regulator n=1 Tax=Dyella sp. EPa41 TaxID=1561194 RepID=UPI001916230E|nr:helix-turn-helix domain-containing protein [Dyella sp. EPa41]